MACMRESSTEAALLLIEKGADVNAKANVRRPSFMRTPQLIWRALRRVGRVQDGITPLWLTAKNGDGLKTAQILLEKGAEVDAARISVRQGDAITTPASRCSSFMQTGWR